jgi:hypothetical protein
MGSDVRVLAMGRGVMAVLHLLSLMASANLVEQHTADFEKLDCGIRRQIYTRAQKLQPFRGVHRETFDALRLHELCGDPPPLGESGSSADFVAYNASGECAFFVQPSGGDDAADGTASRPFRSFARALHETRVSCSAHVPAKTIVLSGGVHYLNQTIELGAADAGLTITSATGEQAWLSGGIPLPRDLAWTRTPGRAGVWQTSLASLGIKAVPGLFTLTPHRRCVG